MNRVLVRGFLILLAACTALALIAPILVIVPMSFSDSTFLTFPPQNWSLRWYRQIFIDASWGTSALNSLRIAVLVTVSAVVLGTAASLGLVRGWIRLRTAVAGLMVGPLVVPYVIVGLAAYAAALKVGLTQTTLGFVLIHTALAVPYVIVNVTAALASYDHRLELAAMNLGANRMTTFFRITLPLIAPSMAAGALFAFIISWDEVVVSLFLAGPELTTLPVRMWSGARIQIDPTITAVSSLLIFFTLTVFAVAGLLRWVRVLRQRRLVQSLEETA